MSSADTSPSSLAAVTIPPCPSNSSCPPNSHPNTLQYHRPKPNAAHPPIKHSPPSGVTGPMNRNLAGSNTKKYRLPLNIVMPAVNSRADHVFSGATDEATRSAIEWIACSGLASATAGLRCIGSKEVRSRHCSRIDQIKTKNAGRYFWRRGLGQTNLILSSGSPVRQPRGVSNAFLEAVSAESTEDYGRRAIGGGDAEVDAPCLRSRGVVEKGL
jgi:hypothetical protein